ncbi:Histidine kinase-%2C DNA gyrase B-%2C and HSP90-like ATPase [Mycobacterium tuberculosis]|nr:Histidine kinase-%2C DNA gyrase B-%2C and HSP90-like ATPase [Mycobacterium tuberculosis]
MAAMVVLGALTVDRDASSVALLRRYVDGALELEGIDAEDLQLITSELGTNAVAHGAGERIRLLLTGNDEHVRVEVSDGGGGEPVVREAGLGAECGRGLMIVEAVAERWGVRRGEAETCVWAEVVRRERVPGLR